jgi:hypothetical protein
VVKKLIVVKKVIKKIVTTKRSSAPMQTSADPPKFEEAASLASEQAKRCLPVSADEVSGKPTDKYYTTIVLIEFVFYLFISKPC